MPKNLDFGEGGVNGGGSRFECLHMVVGAIGRGEVRLQKVRGKGCGKEDVLKASKGGNKMVTQMFPCVYACAYVCVNVCACVDYLRNTNLVVELIKHINSNSVLPPDLQHPTVARDDGISCKDGRQKVKHKSKSNVLPTSYQGDGEGSRGYPPWALWLIWCEACLVGRGLKTNSNSP